MNSFANFSTSTMAALARAELTLLWRNRTAMVTALLLPAAMVAAIRPTVSQFEGADELSMSGGIGFVLVFVVYYNLVTAYVARREELVLKRLRSGEPTDLEILAGSALPAVSLALAQCAVLLASGALLLDLGVPRRPDLLLAGLGLGLVMMAALAAASTVFTRNVELAQITTMPLLLASLVGSGLVVPLDELPHVMAELCQLLPLSPVMTLVRAGWLGGPEAGAYEVLKALATALAWTALAVFAVRRWFRWEPRR
ncbi:ABC transporter permease [Streptomyces sp. NBC_01262]|uniref:ABC transporter permease n=1 Tax=Streptomyces sp. NBC_01262 TaxID=2903803 RepID=UPI002E2F1439|nr:ABC transporter permease [Streptomyces sp. NBC_01262]